MNEVLELVAVYCTECEFAVFPAHTKREFLYTSLPISNVVDVSASSSLATISLESSRHAITSNDNKAPVCSTTEPLCTIQCCDSEGIVTAVRPFSIVCTISTSSWGVPRKVGAFPARIPIEPQEVAAIISTAGWRCSKIFTRCWWQMQSVLYYCSMTELTMCACDFKIWLRSHIALERPSPWFNHGSVRQQRIKFAILIDYLLRCWWCTRTCGDIRMSTVHAVVCSMVPQYSSVHCTAHQKKEDSQPASTIHSSITLL